MRNLSACLQLLSLEDRLPPGDAFLSAAGGAALLGPGLRRAEAPAPASHFTTEFAPEFSPGPFTTEETQREKQQHSRRPGGRLAQPAPLGAIRATALDEDLLATVASAVGRVSRPREASGVLPTPAAARPELAPGAVDVQALWTASALQRTTNPVLAYSTYLGGPGYEWSGDKDAGNDIAVDAAGNIYVAGTTNSIGRWDGDAYVAKFDPTGSTLLYATFLDGSGWNDSGNSIAVDGYGNAYIAGALEGLGAFAAKLDPNGTPQYFVYFGAGPVGYRTDAAYGIAVDGAGNAYVTGITNFWADFPTSWWAVQPTFGGGNWDAFVVKLNPWGAIDYSTYLGGDDMDYGMDIAVDWAGSAYVTGRTDAANFPTTWGAFQPTRGGVTDGFVAKLNPWGSALEYSSYLGGSVADQGNGIALDGAGNAYVTGLTGSLDFPITWGAFQPTYGGGSSDAFVTKVNAAGSGLVYSSYLGGNEVWLGDRGHSIAVDGAGNAHVTGYTIAFDFPLVNPVQPFLAGMSDGFVTKVNAAGSALVYSTYLGGRHADHGSGIAVDAWGNAHVAGWTTSDDFPTTWGAFQPTQGGGDCTYYFSGCADAFAAKIAG